MDNTAIVVNNVSKTFQINKQRGLSKLRNSKPKIKTLKVLDNISFTLTKGEILGIIGLNGSGKTTLLRIIAGVYKPDQGSVDVNGKLSPLMQLGSGFQLDLNARDNIILNGMLLGMTKSDIQEKVNDVIEYAELKNFLNLNLKHFSSGMRARLAFAIAIQINPDILLVDEILSVGDRIFKNKSFETFLTFKKNKKTILHATHNLDKISDLSDKILLLHKGRNLMFGEPEDVIKKYKELKS